MQIFVFLALIIAILAVIFAVQNTALVTVSFLVWEFDGSLALVLLLALAVGALISFLASLPALIRGGFSRRSLRKRASELENNLNEERRLLEEAQLHLNEHKQRLEEAQLNLNEQKQRLDEAELRLRTQVLPDQTAEAGTPPADQPNPTQPDL